MTAFSLSAIGKRIGKARRDRGLTQQELAKLVGKSKQLVSAWEGGRAEILVTSLAKLGRALSVDVAWVLYGTSSNSALPTLPEGKLVPLLRPQQILSFTGGRLGDAKIDKRNYVLGSVSDRAFTLHAIDDGLRPTIAKGDLVTVDPDSDVEPGMLVLVLALAEGGTKLKFPAILIREIRFRTLTSNASNFRLVASHAAYPEVEVSTGGDACIIGPVVGIQKFGPSRL